MAYEPRLPRGVRRLFRLPRSTRRIEGEVSDEVEFHLAMTVQDLMARGWTRERAEAEAQRRFGDVSRWRRALGDVDRRRADDAQRAEWWDALRQDTVYALRGLRRQPGFAAAVVLTLALGMGANATMLGIVDHLMLRPPAHVMDAGRVRRLNWSSVERQGNERFRDRANWAQVAYLRENVRAFERIGVSFPTDMVYGHAPNARQIRTNIVNADFFPLLGVRPYLGRFFTADEDRAPRGTALVVIGYEFWRAVWEATRVPSAAPSKSGRRHIRSSAWLRPALRESTCAASMRGFRSASPGRAWPETIGRRRAM
jgi:putative ABC transport system permease protein